MPLGYGISTSLKTKQQIASLNPSPIPQSPKMFQYKGNSYEVLKVPQSDGSIRELAIIEKGRNQSVFIDPLEPEATPIVWRGQWRTLETVWIVDPQWNNYVKAWETVDFLKLLKNTVVYAIVTTFGTVFSSLLVAYGFARFNFPGKNVLFIVLISTIILPSAVTLIPTYTMFYHLGWVGTWLPLMVPAFFSNAYNVFLLRQFIMGVPREMDEAARIDGAGPIRTLFSVILPQVTPAIISVALFHFFFAWNDFFGPLIYLAGKPDLQPITVGLSTFNNMYTTEVHLVQAASMISCIIPLCVFFFAQRYFIQGVVISGVEK
jgi:multiple sugar transport system permease protein